MTSLIQGASRGIGLAIVECLLERGGTRRVVATCRAGTSAGLEALRARFGDRLSTLALDVTDPATIEKAAAAVEDPVDLLVNATGYLHEDGVGPEKRLEDLDAEALAKSFAVNAIGPALVVRAFLPRLRAADAPVVVNFSARVGSIGDNGTGGWYGYRASKAAQNQITRTLARELARRAPKSVCIAFHPGTVDTDLSRPFRGGPKERFTPRRAAEQMLAVVEPLGPKDTGRFLAWDGSEIPW